MKTSSIIAFLLAASGFTGSAFAQLEGQLPPSTAAPPPPQVLASAAPAPVAVELVIDVYSARHDQNENAGNGKVFARWLQQLRKGDGRYAPRNCPKLFHGRMPVEARQQINKQLPDGDAGSVTIQGEAIRLEGERIRVHFSSLGRPGAKPLGDDEKDQQPVSTSLVMQAGQTRVLRLPDAFLGTPPDQSPLPEPTPTPPGDGASARAIESIVVVLRLEKADDERSRYEVPDLGDSATGPDRRVQAPPDDRQRVSGFIGRCPDDLIDGW
ncbi:MAG: hypothetical protein JO015_10750 [Verrucomicrobia bacterium]|nr:hypothetical protein [Verrucomicrobiota bacterium]